MRFLLLTFAANVLILCSGKLIIPVDVHEPKRLARKRAPRLISITASSYDYSSSPYASNGQYNDLDEEEHNNPYQTYRQQTFAKDASNNQEYDPFIMKIKKIAPLLSQASRISVGFLFFLLVWRLMAILDLIDQSENSRFFTLIVKLLTYLMVACNSAGLILTILKPVATKSLLKGFLALNVLRESFAVLINAVMLLVRSGPEREVHFGRLISNVWWFMLCYSFSKTRWVDQVAPLVNPDRLRQHFEQPQQTYS